MLEDLETSIEMAYGRFNQFSIYACCSGLSNAMYNLFKEIRFSLFIDQRVPEFRNSVVDRIVCFMLIKPFIAMDISLAEMLKLVEKRYNTPISTFAHNNRTTLNSVISNIRN
jgi:hypothetical protein